MTSATEKLRRLLDERGVKYRLNECTKVFEWHFGGADGEGSAHATEVDGGINIMACSLTPEQVIAATLGSGTCHDVWQDDVHANFKCSECGEMLNVHDKKRITCCPFCKREVVDE